MQGKVVLLSECVQRFSLFDLSGWITWGPQFETCLRALEANFPVKFLRAGVCGAGEQHDVGGAGVIKKRSNCCAFLLIIFASH